MGVTIAAAAGCVLVLGAVLAGLAVLGGGWYFAGVLLRPVRGLEYPDRVLAVRDGAVWLARSRWAEQPGEWGLRSPVPEGRAAEVGRGADPVVGIGPVSDGSGGGGAVGAVGGGPVRGGVRRVLRDGGAGPPLGAVALDAGRFGPDPSAVGLAFRTVAVPGPLGDGPAWFVPGAGSTWVLAVHGRGADRRECLRVLPALHALGHPVLAVSYRNDVGAPASPDGHYHLGDSEWADLAAAVRHARAGGARGLVLLGWSMGAAVIGAYLGRAAEVDRPDAPVRAVVWDSPVVDWRATLRRQAQLRRLPPGLSGVAARIAARRAGIDFDRLDLLAHPPAHRPPTLLLHGAADTAVPVTASRALAAAAPGRDWPLRYVEVPGAEHTACWNVDPRAYTAEVTAFLRAHAPS